MKTTPQFKVSVRFALPQPGRGTVPNQQPAVGHRTSYSHLAGPKEVYYHVLLPLLLEVPTEESIDDTQKALADRGLHIRVATLKRLMPKIRSLGVRASWSEVNSQSLAKALSFWLTSQAARD